MNFFDTRRFQHAVKATATVLVLLLNAYPALATLQLSAGNLGGGGVDNVIFNACAAEVLGPAPTVEGCLNTSHTTVVRFTSNENLVADGGQATIVGQDGSFDNVTITLADSSLGFSTLVINIDVTANGSATFQAIDQFGNTFTFPDVPVVSSGENFFTLFSIDDQVAVSFQIVSTTAIQLIGNLDQVRLGPTEVCTTCGETPGETPGEVPEPSSLLLVGAGLIALRTIMRRNSKHI